MIVVIQIYGNVGVVAIQIYDYVSTRGIVAIQMYGKVSTGGIVSL